MKKYFLAKITKILAVYNGMTQYMLYIPKDGRDAETYTIPKNVGGCV